MFNIKISCPLFKLRQFSGNNPTFCLYLHHSGFPLVVGFPWSRVPGYHGQVWPVLLSHIKLHFRVGWGSWLCDSQEDNVIHKWLWFASNRFTSLLSEVHLELLLCKFRQTREERKWLIKTIGQIARNFRRGFTNNRNKETLLSRTRAVGLRSNRSYGYLAILRNNCD